MNRRPGRNRQLGKEIKLSKDERNVCETVLGGSDYAWIGVVLIIIGGILLASGIGAITIMGIPFILVGILMFFSGSGSGFTGIIAGIKKSIKGEKKKKEQ